MKLKAKHLILAAVAISAFVMVAITPAKASFSVTTRTEIFKPNGSGGWTQLDCSSGSVSVDHVGNIRMLAYAKWSGPSPVTRIFRTTYGFPGQGGAEAWYVPTPADIPGNNQEVFVHETVQDLTLGVVPHSFSFTFAPSCTVNATNIPNPDEAQKSARTAYVNSVTSLRWEIRNYADSTLIPCGGTTTSPRVKFALFAVAPVTGDYDFHLHQEIPVASGKSAGPDQMPPTSDVRWWEMGADHIPLVANVETNVLQTTAAQTFGPGTVTFHGMQQHSVAQTSFVETVCTITVI